MDNIVVEFSGWCKIDTKSARMHHFETGDTITGEEWAALSDSEKDNYFLEDLMATLRDSDDNEWTHISFFKEEY